jgi:hypothetical protein
MDDPDPGSRRPEAAVGTTTGPVTSLEDGQVASGSGRRRSPAEVGIRAAILGLVLLAVGLIVLLVQAI